MPGSIKVRRPSRFHSTLDAEVIRIPSSKIAPFLSSMLQSPQRQTAEAVVAAFNVMDIEKIMSFRSSSCMRHIVPASLGLEPQDNARFLAALQRLRPIFENFSLTINDVVEDQQARRICMWLSARADTAAGEYINEYMWTMDFDESGEKLIQVREFVDTVVNKEFWPKLAAAMKTHGANT